MYFRYCYLIIVIIQSSYKIWSRNPVKSMTFNKIRIYRNIGHISKSVKPKSITRLSNITKFSRVTLRCRFPFHRKCDPLKIKTICPIRINLAFGMVSHETDRRGTGHLLRVLRHIRVFIMSSKAQNERTTRRLFCKLQNEVKVTNAICLDVFAHVREAK